MSKPRRRHLMRNSSSSSVNRNRPDLQKPASINFSASVWMVASHAAVNACLTDNNDIRQRCKLSCFEIDDPDQLLRLHCGATAVGVNLFGEQEMADANESCIRSHAMRPSSPSN